MTPIVIGVIGVVSACWLYRKREIRRRRAKFDALVAKGVITRAAADTATRVADCPALWPPDVYAGQGMVWVDWTSTNEVAVITEDGAVVWMDRTMVSDIPLPKGWTRRGK